MRLKIAAIEYIRRNIEGSLFIAPFCIGFLIFMAFPLGFSLFMSFENVRVVSTGLQYRYVGLNNYKEILLNSSVLYERLVPFLQELLIMLPIIIIFSLMIAILLNQRFAGRFFFRAVFFLPVIFSSSYVITEFVNQGQGSLGFLERYQLGEFLKVYLGDSAWSDPVQHILNRFVLILWYSGVQIIIFLAGRQTISSSIYESARIDGASPWEVFWKITLPGLIPFFLLNIIYTIVDMFTFPFNPVMNLVTIGNFGYNSAVAWIYAAFIFLFLGVVMWLFRRISVNYGTTAN